LKMDIPPFLSRESSKFDEIWYTNATQPRKYSYQYGTLFPLNRPCSIDWNRFGDDRMKYKEVSVLRYEIRAGEMRKEWKWIKPSQATTGTRGNVKGTRGKAEK